MIPETILSHGSVPSPLISSCGKFSTNPYMLNDTLRTILAMFSQDGPVCIHIGEKMEEATSTSYS